MPSSLSEQPSRTYKGRLFHFLNRTNLFFLNYCLKDFIQSFNQHTIFFFPSLKVFPCNCENTTAGHSIQRKRNRRMNFRALLCKHVQQSYSTKKEITYLPFTAIEKNHFLLCTSFQDREQKMQMKLPSERMMKAEMFTTDLPLSR